MELLKISDLIKELDISVEYWDAIGNQILELENALKKSKINIPYSLYYAEDIMPDSKLERRAIAWGYHEKQNQFRLLIRIETCITNAPGGNVVNLDYPIEVKQSPFIETKLAIRVSAINNMQKFIDGFYEFLKTTRAPFPIHDYHIKL